MLCFPNCKINIGLYVTRRRSDGYHDIETVFFPLSAIALAKADLSAVASAKVGLSNAASANRIPLNDVLEITPSAQTCLHQSGLALPGNAEENIVLKAYHLMLEKYPGRIPALDIYLHKVIPAGAGLGGGSADGAFMLRLLNDFCHLSLNKEQLTEYALQLGSDCPFFIYNTPQFATGRGECMSEVAVNLSAYSIQIICPQVHVSTSAAFQMMVPKPAGYDLRMLPKLPVAEWKACIGNDFEAPVFRQHPALAEIKEQLYRQGAIYAAMSGSGSAIFGIFSKSQRAEVMADVGFRQFYME